MPAYDPESEVAGEYLVAFVESAGEVSPIFERKVREIFEQHMSPVQSDEWYQTEKVARALEEVDSEIGPKTMREGGAESVTAVPWPDDVASVAEAAEFLQEAHREAYRNSDMENPAGNYTFEQIRGRKARVGVTLGFPSPPAWAEGVFRHLPKEFGPEDATPQLTEKTPEEDEAAAWELVW